MLSNINRSILDRINKRAHQDTNTGFGTSSENYGGRYYHKNGTPNTRRLGLPFIQKYSVFHTMLQLPFWQFMSLLFGVFFLVNFLFALIYFYIGVDQLTNVTAQSAIGKLSEAFFFSCQTFTTVGYGRIAPVGFWMSMVASIEALMGLLALALATGLIYGRFSKPEAFIKFSKNAILAPYKDKIALMIRMAPFKNTILTDAESKMTLGIVIEEGGVKTNKFYSLNLELSKINALSLNWTLVHPIDENSPLYGLSIEDLRIGQAEFIIFTRAFDEVFSNTVVARTSYTAHELLVGAKFKPMYHRAPNAKSTVLEMNLLHETIPVDIRDNKAMIW